MPCACPRMPRLPGPAVTRASSVDSGPGGIVREHKTVKTDQSPRSGEPPDPMGPSATVKLGQTPVVALAYPPVTPTVGGATSPKRHPRTRTRTPFPMNTRDLAALAHWDERELTRLTTRFVRIFHRLPRYDELLAFRRNDARLHLRIPARTRRSLASAILAF